MTMPDLPRPPATAEKKCIACASNIDAAARLCPVCKSHQKEWRNWLPYATVFIGLLTVAASAAVFIAGRIDDLRVRDELLLVDASNYDYVTVFNKGEGPILVKDVRFFCPMIGHEEIRGVNRLLKPAEYAAVSIQGWEGAVTMDPVGATSYMRLLGRRDVKELGKVAPVFFPKHHGLITAFADSLRSLSLEGHARARFLSLTSGRIRTSNEVDLAVVLFKRNPSQVRPFRSQWRFGPRAPNALHGPDADPVEPMLTVPKGTAEK